MPGIPDLLFYDLHLHSCLSPCADNDMTPGNVCAMARLKGLHLIALTDHNSGGNLKAFAQAAKREGLLFLPGMELCTKEEVHLLAYFPDVDSALAAGQRVKRLLPPLRNKPDFFGQQLLVDEFDQVVGEEEALLIGAMDANLEETCALVRSHGGVPVPAHIYRGYGLVQVLGFVPKDTGFRTVETAPSQQCTGDYLMLHSSDAHQLGDISEPEHALRAEPDIESILDTIRQGKK